MSATSPRSRHQLPSLTTVSSPSLLFLYWYAACYLVVAANAEDETTTTSEAPRKKSNAKLAALVLLVIPVAGLMYVIFRLRKRFMARRMANNLRLNGDRKPGGVDDQDIGRALEGGSWLSPSKDGPCTTTGLDGVDVAGAVPKDEFDPVAKQAAAQKERRARRRQAGRVEATNSGSNSAGNARASVFSPASGSDLDEGDDDEDDNDEDGVAPIIYAATMSTVAGIAPGSPLATGPLSGVFASGFDGAGGSGVAAVKHDPELYTATSNLLMNVYHDHQANPRGPSAGNASNGAANDTNRDTEGRGPPRAATAFEGPTTVVAVHGADSALDPSTGGSRSARTQYQHRREASHNFESILTAAAAPLPVAADLRQRGQHDFGDAGDKDEEDDLYYGEEEEEEEDDVAERARPPNTNTDPMRGSPQPAASSTVAVPVGGGRRDDDDDEEYEYEYEEEEEEEEEEMKPRVGSVFRR